MESVVKNPAHYTATFYTLIGVALLYFLAAKLGLMLAFDQESTSPVWPPSGVAIAAVILFGYRIWPAILIASILINMTTGAPLMTAPIIAAGNTAEALVAVWLIRRWIGPGDPLSTIVDLGKFILLAGLIPPLISATTGMVSLLVSNSVVAEQFWGLWLTWWSGNVTGILILTPVLLTWGFKKSWHIVQDQFLEFSLVVLLAVLLTGLSFGPWFSDLLQNSPVTFLTIPPAIWAAFRFGRHGSTVIIVITSLIAIAYTVQGNGPYIRDSMNESLMMLQAFVAMVSIATLVLSGLVEQRRRIEKELETANQKLAKQITRKDRQLSESSDELKVLSKKQKWLMDSSADGFLLLDFDGKIQQVNEAFCKMSGFNKKFLIGNNIQSLLHAVQGGDIENYLEIVRNHNNWHHELLMECQGGKTLEVSCSLTIIDDDRLKQCFAYIRDISAQKKSEQIISALAGQSINTYDDVEFFRDCLVNLSNFYGTRYAFIGLLTGNEPASIETFSVYADGAFVDNFEYMLKDTPCEDVLNLCSELIPHEAARRYPKDTLLAKMGVDSYFGSPMVARNGTMMGLVTVMDDKPLYPDSWAKDILDIFARRIAYELERKKTDEELHGMADRLYFQASHDSITGLLNRREFDIRLKNTLNSVKRNGKQHALCYLDLDQFKVVNDTCGHIAGDTLLKQLAVQLPLAIRNSDTLARLGGDEFGVLLYDCPLEKALEIAKKLQDIVHSFRFVWKDKIFDISVSIGLVPLSELTGDMSEILIAADSACYMAKELGRNRIHVYQTDDNELSKRKNEIQWISRIHEALDKKRFVLYAQPFEPLIINGDGLCFEVLVRMSGENDEIIPPGAFIPAAERYDLMTSIDREVIRSVFQWLNNNRKIIHKISLCTINISAQSMVNEDFLEFLLDLIKETGIEPGILCFEITETAVVANLERALNFIIKSKKLGCRFALDDFGSGMSSFSYLKTLPVEFLKIDGNFVLNIATDPVDFAMVKSIHKVGKVMGLMTVAEFVENSAILEKLREIGIDYAQGFGIATPEPIDNLLSYFKEN